jgi:hypothetical protein
MITTKIGSSGRLGLDSKGNRCYTHDNILDVIKLFIENDIFLTLTKALNIVSCHLIVLFKC